MEKNMNKFANRALNILLMMFFVAMVSITTAGAATFVVNTTNDTLDAAPGNGVCLDAAGACSLRAAIGEANAVAGDDVITVPAGTYTQSLVAADDDANAGGDWDITSNITMNGAGSGTTIIQAAATPATATERVMQVTNASTVLIDGVTIRNGNKASTLAAAAATRGGGIRNSGSLTLQNCIVSGNNSPGGGGLRNELNITLIGTTVSGNSCLNNSAAAVSCFGGGMYSNATGTITITNSTFTGNVANGFNTNSAGFGAGLGIEGAGGFTLNITGSNFTNNTAQGTGTGGGVGGAIRYLAAAATTSNITITNSTISGNSATSGTISTGGAMQGGSVGGTVTMSITDSTVSGNTSAVSEGAIAHINTSTGPSTINILRSTFSGNSAASIAGIRNNPTSTGISTVNVTNSTFSGNNATGVGGAINSLQTTAGTSVINLNFATIASNTSTQGGGINNLGGTINLKNSIVGDNTAATGPDINGAITSQDYNHIENTSGATIGGATGNNATGDAGLLVLANYGGSTQTHFPGVGSAVRNTIPNGTNDCGNVITNDQRGVSRPQVAACDKGSVEVGATAAGVSISGRAFSSTDGRGLTGAIVRLTDQKGSVRTVVTGRLGSFIFEDVEPGQTYVVSVTSRRFNFTPRVIQVVDNVVDLEIVPE